MQGVPSSILIPTYLPSPWCEFNLSPFLRPDPSFCFYPDLQVHLLLGSSPSSTRFIFLFFILFLLINVINISLNLSQHFISSTCVDGSRCMSPPFFETLDRPMHRPLEFLIRSHPEGVIRWLTMSSGNGSMVEDLRQDVQSWYSRKKFMFRRRKYFFLRPLHRPFEEYIDLSYPVSGKVVGSHRGCSPDGREFIASERPMPTWYITLSPISVFTFPLNFFVGCRRSQCALQRLYSCWL